MGNRAGRVESGFNTRGVKAKNVTFRREFMENWSDFRPNTFMYMQVKCEAELHIFVVPRSGCRR